MEPHSNLSLDAYDDMLRDTANAYRDQPPDQAFLALAARARSCSISNADLRRWIAHWYKRGPVVAIAKSRSRCGPLFEAACKHHERSSSLDGRARMRLAAARQIVSAVLSPIPQEAGVGPARAARARAAMAVLGREFLHRATQNGYDTIVMPYDDLGTALGCSEAAAKSALDACVEAGWLRKMPTSAGRPSRWKLPKRMAPDRAAVAWAHSDLIDAVFDGDGEIPFVEMLGLADHPAVTRGKAEVAGRVLPPVGHHAWMVGLCDEAAVDPVEIGMTAKTVKGFRGRWLTAIAAGADSDGLTASLDAYAEIIGSNEAHQIALEQRAQRVEDRATKKIERAQMYAWLGIVLETRPVPTKPGDGDEVALAAVEQWEGSMTRGVRAKIQEESRGDLAVALRKRLMAAKWPEDEARAMSLRISPKTESKSRSAA